MCVLFYIEKKGEKRNNTIKKYVVHSSALLRCEFYPSHRTHKNYFIRGWIFFLFFLLQYFPISLYLCIESIHNMYFNSIVSEWNERCTFEPKLHTMHNHPSLIHSFFSSPYPFIILLVLWFIREILFPSASTSFFLYFFFVALCFLLLWLLLLFMYQTAFFDVTLIFPYSEGCQWWMRKERAQRAIFIHL